MVSKLASLLGDAPPSLEELKHISKSPSTTNVAAQSTKSAPIQNPDQNQTKTLIRQDQPSTSAQQVQKDVKSDDNDLISSILEQVTTGVKSTFIPPQIPSAPAPSQQQSPMKRPSQEVNALTTPTKIQKKKRSRKNKKNKNKVIPEVVHRDTPKEEEDVDFDTEMDRYFQATTNAQKKQEEEKTEPISSHEQKDTSAQKYSSKKRSMEEVAYESKYPNR